jgi:uroporphyrinogen-III synthase
VVAVESETRGRPRVLVTRPSADALPLAAELQRRGFDVLLQPLLRIELEGGPLPDLAGVQALLFTSANGVRAFCRRSEVRTLPVYAVGDATARAATAERFLSVESAAGNVDDLANLVRGRLDPAAGRLMHIAGSAVAGDLSGSLEDAGFTVERVQAYSAHPTEALDPSIHSAIAAGAVDGAMFFSPRSAATFVSLVKDAALTGDCGRIRAFGLSDAVAKALSPVPWRAVYIAPEPTQESLLAILERELTDTSQSDTPEPEDSGKTGDRDLLDAGDAAAVVDRFGGIRPMASKLGIPVTTVQGWRARGHIPENRNAEIRRAAAEHGVDLTPGTETAAADSGESSAASSRGTNLPVKAQSKAESTEETMTEDTPPASSPAAEQRSGAGAGVAWAALILAVIALAAIASYRYWGPSLGEQSADTAALAARIDKLEVAAKADSPVLPKVEQMGQKLESLSRQVAALPPGGEGDSKALSALSAKTASLKSSLDALTRKVGQSETRAGAALKDAMSGLRSEIEQLRQSVSEIADRVKAIEDRPPATGEKIAALAVAAGQLESALDSGKPYTGPLSSLQALAAGDAEIEKALAALEVGAGTGVPTLTALTRQFAEIAPKLTVPSAEGESGSWTETLKAKALSLVNMRPVGDAGDSSPVTRAERALGRNDLAGAFAAMEGVPGLAVSWRDRAKRRLDADAAIAEVRSRIVERLAAETHAKAGTGSMVREKP